MKFEIIGEIVAAETIAIGAELRDRRRLSRLYGRGNWRKMKGWTTVRLPDGTICDVEIHWSKRMASAKKSSRSKSRLNKRPQRPTNADSSGNYAICVCNDDYPSSLELRKLYLVIEDDFANDHGMIRVIDESGEDYLFPGEYFLRVTLPEAVAQRLRKIA